MYMRQNRFLLKAGWSVISIIRTQSCIRNLCYTFPKSALVSWLNPSFSILQRQLLSSVLRNISKTQNAIPKAHSMATHMLVVSHWIWIPIQHNCETDTRNVLWECDLQQRPLPDLYRDPANWHLLPGIRVSGEERNPFRLLRRRYARYSISCF